MTKDHDDQLAELLLKWEEAWDLGNDIPASTLCADCPELAQKLNDQIRLLKSMNWMKKDISDEIEVPNEVDLLIGKTLAGRYRIDSIVGCGGHGKVYKSFDPELQRDVAIKVSRKVASDRQSDELLEEARRAAKLKHPNIVAVYDFGRHDGQLFFVTELVDGKNLADIIADSKPSISDAKRIITSVAEALDFAHQQGFLHRDIKPANILLDTNGRVMVTDFGIATTIDKIQNHRGGTPGTLPYMAPEQIAGEVQLIDGRTDIHALGVVLYELLTGELPYQGRTPTAVREQILLRLPKPLSDIDNSIPKHLEDVCLKCLSKHPADRFGKAAEFAVALQQSSIAKGTYKLNRWSQWAPVLGGVALVAVMAFAAGRRFGNENSNPAQTSAPTIPFVANSVMNFDGRTRIVTKLKSFYPCTLECWCRIEEFDSKVSPQAIIGSDIPTKHGLSMGISTHVPFAETVDQTFFAPKSVPINSWIHLAVVFSQTETRIYLDGKHCMVGPPSKPLGDIVFVIGNIGLDNPLCYFRGQVRSIRISRGEEYTSDFTPEENLTAKEATELLYTIKSIDGDAAKDLSGKGNDGKITFR